MNAFETEKFLRWAKEIGWDVLLSSNGEFSLESNTATLTLGGWKKATLWIDGFIREIDIKDPSDDYDHMTQAVTEADRLLDLLRHRFSSDEGGAE